MSEPYNILYIEDSDACFQTAKFTIEAEARSKGGQFVLHRARTLGEATARLTEDWDALLLDLTLPDADIEATLAWLEKNAWRLQFPVIVLSGTADTELQWRAMECGAQGFLFKTQIADPAYCVRVILSSNRRQAYFSAHISPDVRALSSINLALLRDLSAESERAERLEALLSK